MIFSMTGFGRARYQYNQKNFVIEIKSLNSKNLDANLRMPSYYKVKEIEIRKLLSENVIRGKVDFSIQIESQDANKVYSVNASVVQNYMQELQEISPEASSVDLLNMSMRLPEVLSNDVEEVSQEEWSAFLEGLNKAFGEFNQFRLSEGKALEEDFIFQINTIDDLLEKVDPFLEDRNEKMEGKLKQALEKTQVDYDEQRYHQELMFYLERWDVTEEKVRLKQHLEYFIQTVQNEEKSKGKLLGFICQEIGREVNTLGSKANQSDIQKIVVQMKDSLEKIKEQVYNVL